MSQFKSGCVFRNAREQAGLWRDRELRRYAGLATLVGVVLLGLLTYAPLALQALHGLDATTTGWLLAQIGRAHV